METMLFAALVVVGGLAVWLRVQLVKAEKTNERLKLATSNYQSQLAQTENQLHLTTGEYEARQKEIFGQLGDTVMELDRALNMFPHIEDINTLLSRMSPEDIANLDLPFGHEYQAGMTQIAAQKAESLAKLHEFGLRFVLYLLVSKMTGAVLEPSTKLTAEMIVQQQDQAKTYARKIHLPGYRELYAMTLAVNGQKIEKAVLNGEEPPTPERVARFSRAIEEAAAALSDGEELPQPAPADEDPPGFFVSGPFVSPQEPHANGRDESNSHDQVVGSDDHGP